MNGSTPTRSRPRLRPSRALVVATTLLVALSLSLWLAHTAGAAQPVVVDDTQVNNSSGDTGNNTTQSEPSLAVRGSTVCSGFNDSGGTGFSGLARSTNGGQSWTDLGSLGAGSRGDPTLAVNLANGRFYYGEIATIGGNPAIGVARSTDDCQTFGAPVDAAAASSGLTTVGNHTTLSDKPSVAVDNTGGANNGNVYVCWTRFIDTSNPIDNTAEQSELRFSRSTDGGATYVNEQVLQVNGTAPFGCSVKVGPNGEVYVVWADRAGGTAGDIRFRASTNAGQSFGANTQVATARAPGSDNFVLCGTNNNRPTLNGNIRMLHQAWMAVDTGGGSTNGNIYVVWATDPTGNTDNSDVFFSRSTNGGANWSTPLQLGGTNATDQFEPNVAVGGDEGSVSVVWFDRQNDAANNLQIDVYKAFSTDGGATFGTAQRVTNQAFGVPQLNPNFDPGIATCYMGEYLGIAADAGTFYYIWGDNRNTVTNVQWPSGRPDPDVWFESESAPDAPISATGVTFNAVEGAPFSGQVATFTDPDTTATAAEYSATIDWGDGSASSSGTITGGSGSFSVTGSHTYQEEGTYAVTVTITDVDNASNTAKANSTAKVADAPLASTCVIGPTAPNPFSGNVAQFTDANPFGPLSDFTATIHWGDGTSSAGAISGPTGGPFLVSGSHTYATTGLFTIAVQVVDVGGSTTSTTCTVLVFSFAPGGGAFVIGDLNSAVGTSVTFWGAQWARSNSLSGGPAPAAFKGFAKNPATPSCGTAWSTGPGNSAPPPPGPLPAYMGVIVTSSASMSGSQISGNTPHIVVVQTSAGYDTNPGHAGTGQVVARFC